MGHAQLFFSYFCLSGILFTHSSDTFFSVWEHVTIRVTMGSSKINDTRFYSRFQSALGVTHKWCWQLGVGGGVKNRSKLPLNSTKKLPNGEGGCQIFWKFADIVLWMVPYCNFGQLSNNFYFDDSSIISFECRAKRSSLRRTLCSLPLRPLSSLVHSLLWPLIWPIFWPIHAEKVQ